MRDKPKECCNNNCNTIIYVPYYLMHQTLQCDKCVDRLVIQSELYGDI